MRYRGVNEVAIAILILDSVLILCLISNEEYKVKHHLFFVEWGIIVEKYKVKHRLFPCRMGLIVEMHTHRQTKTHPETDTHKHAIHISIYTHAFMI